MASKAVYYLLGFCGLTGLSWARLISDLHVVTSREQPGLESSEGLTGMDVQDDSLVAAVMPVRLLSSTPAVASLVAWAA